MERDTMDKIMKDMKHFHASYNTVSEQFLKLQYQLFIIASGTFSIYLAIKTTAPEGLIKWGFISLAGSLIFGLFSIISHISHEGWSSLSQWIDIERKVFGSDSVVPVEVKQMFNGEGYPVFSNLEGLQKEKMEMGMQIMRWLGDRFYPFSFWCALAQLLLFLSSTILIFTGLFYI